VVIAIIRARDDGALVAGESHEALALALMARSVTGAVVRTEGKMAVVLGPARLAKALALEAVAVPAALIGARRQCTLLASKSLVAFARTTLGWVPHAFAMPAARLFAIAAEICLGTVIPTPSGRACAKPGNCIACTVV